MSLRGNDALPAGCEPGYQHQRIAIIPIDLFHVELRSNNV
jgi:hypothetical protein